MAAAWHCMASRGTHRTHRTLANMSLTSAVAAANAVANAAAAGKKAAQVQLQAELNTDDEWTKFLTREGLLVIDVYSEWCGPCIGMVGNLKKIKVELGGDNLHLAVAKADTIECLKRFRNRSEPTWMFISAGQLVNVVFGADAPRLARTIEQELKNEELVKKGELERPKRAPHELTPQEQEVADAQEKLLNSRKEKEAAAAEAQRNGRREARAKRLEAYFMDVCPALMLPHAQKHLRKVSDALEPLGIIIADKCPLLVGKDIAKNLAVEDPELGSPAAIDILNERPSLTLLLKKQPDREGDVIELIRHAIFGDGVETEEDEPPKRYLSEELRMDAIPGIFVPSDRHKWAAALDLLFPKMVGTVVEPPTQVEPPHVALCFGAWQRRAILTAAAAPNVAPKVLRYGFFADINVNEPKLLCKTLDQYEQRPDKDYCETIVLMVAVGPAEPALANPDDVPGVPVELLKLGPLHTSEDFVIGAEECARFFPSGYSVPEPKPKPKAKKKKKKRHENKEEAVEGGSEVPQSSDVTEVEANGEAECNGEGEGDAEGEGEGEGEGEAEGEGEEEEGEGEEVVVADKATSPPPQTPH